MTIINNRYEFVALFEAKDGNPNGDPDNGNRPRSDIETGHGLMSDPCNKRKVRNYVHVRHGDRPGYAMFVQEGSVLNQKIEEAYTDLGINLESKDSRDDKKRREKGKAQGSEILMGKEFMCKKYFDIRAFGAVLSTGANAGQVKGPVQFGWARSIDPINAMEHCVTRMAVTTEDDAEKQADNRTMGRKYTVPYALYRLNGYVTPAFAKKTGFSEEDLEILWESILNMFELDHSSARGEMSCRGLIVFKHDSEFGNASSADLFDKVEIALKDGVPMPRKFSDYSIRINSNIPKGVEVIVKR